MRPLAEHDYRPTLRPRLLLLVADPDVEATEALAEELATFHIDTELCDDFTDALLAAGMLRPDAVLLGAEQEGLSRAAVVAALRKRADIPVVVGISADDGGAAVSVLAVGAPPAYHGRTAFPH